MIHKYEGALALWVAKRAQIKRDKPQAVEAIKNCDRYIALIERELEPLRAAQRRAMH